MASSSIPNIAKNRTEFQTLAVERLEDAVALLAANRYRGAYYIAGYAVECILKACISKNIGAGDFLRLPEPLEKNITPMTSRNFCRLPN